MRIPWAYLVTFVVLLICSCNPDENVITKSSKNRLFFSTDTVSFDTLLTDTTSITMRLRISNPNDKAIKIDEIRLAGGTGSDYSIIINGKPGPFAANEILYGGDSLLILAEAKILPRNQNTPYLVRDSIIVVWNQNQKDIKLISWGQDTKSISQEVICDQVWTAERPYFIQQSILIDSLCSLTIEAGTKIYLGKDVSIFNQGTLTILGDSSEQVIIRNSRFDDNYLEAPGQWGGIFFLEGSKNNVIDFAVIENGQIGLRIGSPDEDDIPDVIVRHTIIRHMSVAGILAFTSDMIVENTLIHNADQYLVGNFAGGNYTYAHCTFTNLPNSFIRDEASVQFSDHIVLANDELLESALNVSMTNSIVWGGFEEELLLVSLGNVPSTVNLSTNVIKSMLSLADNLVSSDNAFPGFVDPFNFDYCPDSTSILINKGLDLGILDDITGKPRDGQPDIGAFEY